MSITKIFLLTLFEGLQSGFFCQRWEFPSAMVALIGSCVEIPCTYSPAVESEKSYVVWYLHDGVYYIEIFNSRISLLINDDYINRTSLAPGGSCSLRIDPVRRSDRGQYYPGVAGSDSINAFSRNDRTIALAVTDSPGKPVFTGTGDMMEGNTTVIQCHIDHTCASSPPSLKWSKPGQRKKQSISLSRGNWREVSELTYIPSYEDDRTSIRCTATYHSGLRSQTEFKLNIKYAPIKVHIIQTEVEYGVIELKCDFLSSKPNVTHYSWMKDNSLLHMETGQIMLLYHSKENNGNYSCVAHNNVGSSSSAGLYIEDMVQEATNRILYLAISGIVGLLLILIIIYFCWRKKVCHTSPSTETAELQDATYTDLVKSNVSEPYDTLKPVIPAELTVTARNGAAITDYENVITRSKH